MFIGPKKHLLKALPKMQKAATTEELQTAIEQHIAQTEGHVGRLEQGKMKLNDVITHRLPQSEKCVWLCWIHGVINNKLTGDIKLFSLLPYLYCIFKRESASLKAADEPHEVCKMHPLTTWQQAFGIILSVLVLKH